MNVQPDPRTEAEHEDAVVQAGRALVLDWFRFVGSYQRALSAGNRAERAGVKGALRLLPSLIANLDPQDPGFLHTLREPVLRGIVTHDEAERALRGEL